MMPHFVMFLAEIDPIQIIIIVIAIGAGFVQWLWGLIKQKAEESERRNATPLTPEDRAAREEAWRKQVAQPGPGHAPRPSPQSTPPVQDPWATVRDVFEQIKEEARKAQNPQVPPPVPQRPSATSPRSLPQPTSQTSLNRPRRHSVRAELQPVPVAPPAPADPFPTGAAKAVTPNVTPPVSFATAPAPPLVSLTTRPAAQDFSGLRQLLHSPASLKQAVLLREILGPPKALQSSGDSPF